MKTSMIASFSDADRKFLIEEVCIPQLSTGQILVKILYTTICRSDIYTFQGIRKEKSPTILGHEIVGTIVAFGQEINKIDLRGHRLSVGDRITWGIYAGDPNSYYSSKGIPQKSHDLFKYGHEQITDSNTLHGGLSDYIILRANTPIIRISDCIPDQVSALINCSVATVAGAFRLAGKIKDQTVLINGTGMLGVIACAFASHLHAKKIIAIDKNIDRLSTALKFGAEIALEYKEDYTEIQQSLNDQLGKDLKIDIVMEFSGTPDAMFNTLHLLDIGGTAVWVGATFPQEPVHVNAEMIVRRLLTIKGLHNYNEKDLISAVAFIESCHDKFDFESMITGGFELKDVNQAFETAVNENPFRVGIAGIKES